MSTTTTIIPELLRAGLWDSSFRGIGQTKPYWKEIIPNMNKSRQSYEEIVSMSGLGLMRRIDETEPYPQMLDVPRGKKRYVCYGYGGAVVWNRSLKNRDIYNYTKRIGQQLGVSFVETRNFLAARTLVSAASLTLSLATTSWDGAAIFGTHTTSRGTSWSNRFTLAASATNLQSLIAAIKSAPSDVDTPKRFDGGFKLICGPAKVPLFTQIVHSEGLAGTADNDTNQYINSQISKIYEEDWMTSELLGYPNSYFLLPNDDSKSPFIGFEVQPYMTDAYEDKDKRMWKLASFAEFSFDGFDHYGCAASIV